MEVVRSCFSSSWRLFHNRPEATPGRYIFCDDSTPVYPGWHNLWSRDWTSDDGDQGPLGEAKDAVRRYSLGAPIGPIAPPVQLGDSACIALGERWPLAVIPTLIGGFPSDCFVSPLTAAQRITPLDPLNWCFWARLLELSYTDAAGALAQAAAAFAVGVTGYALQRPTPLTPCYFVLNSAPPAPVLVCIAGTDTATQWIVQFFYGARPPSNVGDFATHILWNGIAHTILDKMLQLGVNPTQDIYIVGHSLGGAVAAVLAALLRLGQPQRRISLATFGCPRPGDQRLIDILNTCNVVSVQNELDVVTGIPSNFSDIPPTFQPIVASAYPPGSRLWASQPNRYRVSWNGTVAAGAADPGIGPALSQIVTWGIGGGPFPDFSAHLPHEYVRRLCSPAPLPVAWADAYESTLPDGSPVAAIANRVDASNGWTYQSGVSFPPFVYRNRSGFPVALQFTNTTGLQLQHAVAVGTDWFFASALDVVREFGDSGKAVLDAPVGNRTGAIGPSWVGSSPFAGEFSITSLGVSAVLNFAGNNGGPLLLSGSECGGDVTAQLESGTGIDAATQSGGGGDSNGFSSIGYEFHSGPPPQYPELWLGEVLLYAQCLTPVQEDSVNTYLRLKWVLHGIGITTEGDVLLASELDEPLITE